MKADGELLEWAQVHDNFYGTPRARVEEQLAAGNDILFDVDYQGTLQLYEKSRKDMVTVFILPPTIRELRARLERRAQDSAGTIEKRLRNAKIEMQHYSEYDYIIINEDLEASTQKVRSILAAARLARPRLTQLDNFVKDLQNQIDSL
jgi:guanylate kinase